MALVLLDRVRETTFSIGTGTITLSGAVAGYQTFSAIGNGNTTYYTIYDTTTNDWEVGIGTYTLSGNTLSRTTVLSSSNGGSLVPFAAGSKEVFVTYPAGKAIYEEVSGNVLIDGGPITVIGTGVTGYTSLAAALGEMYANINNFAQFYAQNQNDGSEASTDFVVENDLGTDVEHYADFGINSSNFSSSSYPIYTPNSGYLYAIGATGAPAELFLGSGDGDVVIHAGGFDVLDEAVRVDAATKAVTATNDVNVFGALNVTGAAAFQSTVLLSANPTNPLQAATKQYVDNQVTTGVHIHEPVRVETTGNLNAAYTQGGTTFDITDITGTTTVTTSVNHGLSVNDQIWLYSTAGNGLSTNTAYFVYSIPAPDQLTLSLTFGGAQITGLTNAFGLTYATRANSGVGATLTNAGTKAALQVDGVNLTTTDRVMVRLQTNGEENGVYVVTTVGTPDPGGTNWVLTRATDSNQVNPADPNGVGTGDYYFTREGLLNAGDSHVLTTEPNTMIIGYTPLTYTQFSGGVAYTGGTNIDVTGQTISLTGTVAATNGGTGVNTVATGDLLYGSATNTWSKLPVGAAYKSLVVNGSGTQVEWNAVALNQPGAVSGALPATNGGTGISSYAVGDIIYSSATNTLTVLSGNTTTTKKFLNQTGTGSASAAPVWSTIANTDVSGLGTMSTQDANSVAITGGSIDNTTVGATTPTTGKFTSLGLTGSVSGTTTFQAAATTTTTTYTLPAADGLSGYVLRTNGSGTLSWGATGDVVGPASATDNAVAIYDGTTGKLLKNSAVTIGSTGNTVISGTDNTNAMLRVTQLGTGNAITVEDDTSPDTTAFFIDNTGNAGFKSSVPAAGLSASYAMLRFPYTVIANPVNGFGIEIGSNYYYDSLNVARYNGAAVAMKFTVGESYDFCWYASSVGFANQPVTGLTKVAAMATEGSLLLGADAAAGFVRQRITLGNTTSVSTATPEAIDMGGTYSSAAGLNPKLKLWFAGTDFYGLGVSSSQLDYSANGNHVWYNNAGGVATKLMFLSSAGQLGIGIDPDGSSLLHLGAGTASAAPLELTSGTLMTTPDTGSMEYDGVNLYFTNDDVSRRGRVPTEQLFRLTANGAAIGPAINNFFGANSAVNLSAGGIYELEAYCYFTKTTAGTVVVTLTASQTPVLINGTVDLGAITGGTATGAANRISLFASTTGAFGASGSLTTGVNHAFVVRAIIYANAANASNLRVNFTSSAGTVTPLNGSYYKLRRLPAGNVGSFAA